uniref:hypothetical protein n=1 Tax=Infundibulicybe hongyinpan TaxID=2486348 RepID=UPI00315D8D1C
MCAGISLTKNYKLLPYPFDMIILIIGLIHLLSMTIISIVKINYSIKKLRNNPEDFEIRNSPLNIFGSKITQFAYCWIVSCTILGSGLGVIGSGAIIDDVLESSGHSKVFYLC